MYYPLISSMNKVLPVNALWNNLKAYWTGDNTPNDAKGIYNGTLVNGATYTTGKINNGFNFDGTNDYVSISPTLGASLTSPSNSHSYSVWIYPTIIGSFHTIISNGEVGVSGTIFCLSSGNIRMYYKGGTFSYISPTTYSANVWTHIVLTYSAGIVKVYKNGVLDSTSSALTWTDTGTNCNTYVGTWKPDTGFYKGQFDELGAWTRELTGTEVTELYNSGSGKQYPL